MLLVVPVPLLLLLAVSFLGPDDEDELRLRRPVDEIIIDGRSKVKVMRRCVAAAVVVVAAGAPPRFIIFIIKALLELNGR